MPDRDHSPNFWQHVANQFKDNSAVLFDIFNEPFPDNNNWNSEAGWKCWRDGGYCSGVDFNSAGMQDLVTTVRSTGARNIITLGGLAYSNSLAQWLTYKPSDPTGNIAASWHSYNFNYCIDEGCWNQYVLPVLRQYPVLVTEFGENDCNSGYINSLLPWLDQQGASYSAWTWNTWSCSGGPSLISDYNGTPTNYGAGYRAHLQKLEQLYINSTSH
jgi:endoglucanase